MAYVIGQTARLLALAAALASLGLSACGTTGSTTAGNAAAPSFQQPVRCVELKGMDIPAASIGLPTLGAVVTDAQTVAAAGAGAAAIGSYCKVLGEIRPVDAKAPHIRFQVDLPVAWNRKAMMYGGGYNGLIANPAANVPAGPADKPVPLARGYATFGSDSGHQGNASGSRDGSFGANDEALRNFSGDAIKKTRDTAMAILRAHYAAMPARTYFAGGSTGGREALLAVSNWPQDFDGAIVLYPAWNAAALDLQFGRITRQLAQPGAYPDRAKRKLLFDAAYAACDGLDGVKDGLISNQAACNATFQPATAMLNGKPLRCPGGADTGDGCLSDAQIASFNTIDTPLRLDYALASGETVYPGFNTWGTDFGIPNPSPLQPTVLTLSMGTEQPANPMPGVTAAAMPPYGSTFWDQWVRYFVTRDAGYDALSLDPQKPGRWQERIVALTAIQDANKTDLSPFVAKGGKILMAHGLHDALVSTRATEQYLERLNKAMGASRVAGFLRYYEIPGYGHFTSSVFNASWDSVTALENWVEQGVAPADQVVADTAGVPGRTRPLCAYPAWAKYAGSGDVNSASSYRCATR